LVVKLLRFLLLKNENIDKLIETAKSVAGQKKMTYQEFEEDVEKYIKEIEEFSVIKDNPAKRWLAVKLFEQE